MQSLLECSPREVKKIPWQVESVCVSLNPKVQARKNVIYLRVTDLKLFRAPSANVAHPYWLDLETSGSAGDE